MEQRLGQAAQLVVAEVEFDAEVEPGTHSVDVNVMDDINVDVISLDHPDG